MKSMGKPYAGKPHVRFEEGVDGAVIFSPVTLLYWLKKNRRTSASLSTSRRSKKVATNARIKASLFESEVNMLKAPAALCLSSMAEVH